MATYPKNVWIGDPPAEPCPDHDCEDDDPCAGEDPDPCDHAPWATLQLSVSNSSFDWVFGEYDIPPAFDEPCLFPCAASGSTTPITLRRTTSPAGATYHSGDGIGWPFLDCHWYGDLCLGGREAIIILVAYGDREVPESVALWDLRIYFPVDTSAEHPDDEPGDPGICEAYSEFYPWPASAVYERVGESPLGTYTKIYDDTSGTVPATIDVQEAS